MRPLIAALTLLLMLPALASAAVPENAEWTEEYIETPGQPTLHVDVLKPKGVPAGARIPTIVSVGPYFAHSGSTPDGPTPFNDGPQLRWSDLIEDGKLFERGYALVQVDLRGFGASQGCNDFGGTGEQTDVKRAVEWAASQPWTGGSVAIYGKSYDAWTAVMALDEKPKGLGAAIIMSPIIEGYRTLYMNGVHYDYGWYATPGLYQSIDAMPPTPFDSPEYIAGSAMGTNPACYAQNIALQNSTLDHDTDFWRERDLPAARGSDVPVLWSHGFHDANTKPDNFMDVWSQLKGPKRAWFGQFAHDRGNEAEKVGHAGFFDDVFTFLDRHIAGDKKANPKAEPAVEVAEGDGRWRHEAQWPPADGTAKRMAVNAGTFTDAPSPAFGRGDATWSVSQPFPYEARISGVPRLTVEATTSAPRGHLVAQLFDVDPEGKATLMTRGAHVVQGAAGKLTFELYPQDWTVLPGHRLALRVTADDLDWFTPPHSGQAVDVTGGHLELPFLAYIRDGFTEKNETPSIRNRQELELSADEITAAAAALELPKPLVPRPRGLAQGSAPPPRGARRPANKLAVKAKRKSSRRLGVTVTGGSTSKVALTLVRGKKTVARRTRAPKKGVVRTTFKLPRAGRYRVLARTVGGIRLTGASKFVRVR